MHSDMIRRLLKISDLNTHLQVGFLGSGFDPDRLNLGVTMETFY